MGGNLLTEVPETVGNLSQLQALILCDNHIDALPTSIARLANLKSLLLHKNRLKHLPRDIISLKNLVEVCKYYCASYHYTAWGCRKIWILFLFWYYRKFAVIASWKSPSCSVRPGDFTDPAHFARVGCSNGTQHNNWIRSRGSAKNVDWLLAERSLLC